MPKGDVQELPVEKRPERTLDVISTRVLMHEARKDEEVKPGRKVEDGVQPLNPGFFKLEEMRAAKIGKLKIVMRKKSEG